MRERKCVRERVCEGKRVCPCLHAGQIVNSRIRSDTDELLIKLSNPIRQREIRVETLCECSL